MKDTRTVLDNIRAKIPGDAKLLVAYIDNNGILRCAQANSTQSDILSIANTLYSNAMSESLLR